MNQEFIDNLTIEIRRGTLILAVLSQLKQTEYGYSLLKRLEKNNVEIEANTLYPLLRRLESQGILDSSWDTNEARPRKYYVLSDAGREAFNEMIVLWTNISKHISHLLEDQNG